MTGNCGFGVENTFKNFRGLSITLWNCLKKKRVSVISISYLF